VHRKAVEYIDAHHNEAAAVYSKVWNVSLDEAKKILPKYYDWHHWNAGDFSKQGLDAVADGLRSVGELKGPVDWSKLIDQEFLPKDLQRKL
jgi:NitT/TauT family transport system substrate-binding protein